MGYEEKLAELGDQYAAELRAHQPDRTAPRGYCLCGVDCLNPVHLNLHIDHQHAAAAQRYERAAKRLQREAEAERAIAYEAMRTILPPRFFDRLDESRNA